MARTWRILTAPTWHSGLPSANSGLALCTGRVQGAAGKIRPSPIGRTATDRASRQPVGPVRTMAPQARRRARMASLARSTTGTIAGAGIRCMPRRTTRSKPRGSPVSAASEGTRPDRCPVTTAGRSPTYGGWPASWRTTCRSANRHPPTAGRIARAGVPARRIGANRRNSSPLPTGSARNRQSPRSVSSARSFWSPDAAVAVPRSARSIGAESLPSDYPADQHIGRLDVQMQHTGRCMASSPSATCRSSASTRPTVSGRGKLVPQVGAVDVGHHHVRPAAVLTCVDDGQHVRVVDCC